MTMYPCCNLSPVIDHASRDNSQQHSPLQQALPQPHISPLVIDYAPTVILIPPCNASKVLLSRAPPPALGPALVTP